MLIIPLDVEIIKEIEFSYAKSGVSLVWGLIANIELNFNRKLDTFTKDEKSYLVTYMEFYECSISYYCRGMRG